MTRREFITLIGGAAAFAPALARAQPPMPMIGVLSGERGSPWMREFLQGLSEVGLVEGRDVTIERHFVGGQAVRLPALAAELIHRKARVIVAAGIPAMQAARGASATVPIVFFMGGDPVKLGIVKSLNRPDGNLTGVTVMGVEVGPKRIELLHELLPKATVFAALVNPANPGAAMQSNELLNAAGARGLTLHILHASAASHIDDAFTALVRLRADGLVVGVNALFTGNAAKIAALAQRHAVPTIFQNRQFVESGGLVSYGGSNADMFRQVGVYAGRIVKGASTADLPVQQATKIEMIINLKAAKALGITVPLPLLGRADDMIE